MSESGVLMTVSKRLRTLVRGVQLCGERVTELLEYLDPGPVVPVPMTVGQLVASIVSELAAAGIDIERTADRWTGLHFVRVDLARLPRILGAMRRHVAPAGGLRLQVGTTLVGKRAALLVVLRARQASDQAERRRARRFEW